MSATAAIAERDVRGVLGSGFGVALAAGFAGLAGILVVIDLRGNLARLDQWFAAMFVVVGLVATLLTMRSFADEERTGQIELLLTAPIRHRQLVAGKFVGAAAVLIALLACTLGAPLLVAVMGHPDAGPIVTGYAGLVGVGLAFVAVGLAVSASTSNSLVSASGTGGLLLALWFGGLLGHGLRGRPRVVLDQLSPATHVTGYLRGTLSLNDATYFGSLIVAGLAATVIVLRARR